jgi:hypothetical protein
LAYELLVKLKEIDSETKKEEAIKINLIWSRFRIETEKVNVSKQSGCDVWSLFNDAFFSNSNYTESNKRVICEWRIGKEVEEGVRGLILRYYPSTCMEVLRKTTKTLSQDSGSPCRDINLRLPEYEAGGLTTRPKC